MLSKDRKSNPANWQSRGQGFESPILHQIKNTAFMAVFLIFVDDWGIRTPGPRGYREMESPDLSISETYKEIKLAICGTPLRG